MERVFMEDRGRYRAGEVKDWPVGTWRSFFPDYEKFTKPLGEVTDKAVQDIARKPATKRRRAGGR